MFNLREYIKKGFLDAVGKMADHKIILNSAGWFDKGVLEQEDLEEINAKIEEYHTIEITDNPEEESVEEEAPAEESEGSQNSTEE